LTSHALWNVILGVAATFDGLLAGASLDHRAASGPASFAFTLWALAVD
jgi:hypothetical protein